MHRSLPLLAAAFLVSTGCVTSLGGSSLFGANVDAKTALARATGIASDPDASAADVARAGWVALVRGGDTDTARARWKAAIAKDPKQPLAWLGLAEAARARLDHAAAGRAYLAILERDPGDPLAELAIERLPAVLGVDAGTDADARRVVEGLATRDGVLPQVRAEANEVLSMLLERDGDFEKAEAVAIAAGAPKAYEVSGPYSRFSALDIDRDFAPAQRGFLAKGAKGPLGPIPPRVLPAPGGRLDLSGEPNVGDVFYAATDVTVPHEGSYLLFWETGSTVGVRIDGALVLERDGIRRAPPNQGLLGLELAKGRHRVMIRILRHNGAGDVRLVLLSADGRPAGATWSTKDVTTPPGPPPAWSKEPKRPPVGIEPAPPGLMAEIARQLSTDPTNSLAGYLAALHLYGIDDEAAKGFDERVVKAAPHFAWAHFLEARLASHDGALPGDLRAGRSATAAGLAAKDDPKDAAARLLLARIAIGQSRFDDAQKRIDEAATVAPAAPELGMTRAELDAARGLGVLARQDLENALRARPRSCSLRRAVYDARDDDDDLAGTDAASVALRPCGRSGYLTWAGHRATRGDIATAEKAFARMVKIDPTRIHPALQLAHLLASQGKRDEAVKTLEATLKIWPRVPNLCTRIAQLLADEGKAKEARKWRERALALDPGDLSLRSSLAFEDGHRLLDWGALDLPAEIKAFEKKPGPPAGTNSVIVVDHAAVQAMADDPERPVVLERVQNVSQVLTKKGIDQNGEVSLPANADVVDLYVQKKDGRILEPEQIAGKTNVSMPNLEIGDYVVYDYVQANGPRNEDMPGWTAHKWYTQVFDVPLYRSTYVARAPASLGLKVEAHNIKAAPVVNKAGTLQWSYEVDDSKPLHQEANSVDGDEYLPWFRVGAGAGPVSFGDTWGDALLGRMRATPEVRTFAAELLAKLDKKTQDDKAKLARAVATKIDETIQGSTSSNRFFDEGVRALVRHRGNRLMATRAVLTALGIKSRVALIRPFESDPAHYMFPDGSLYWYAVLRVDVGGGKYLWIDQNDRTAPVGVLRPVHASRPAMLIAEPGRPTQIVATPPSTRDVDAKSVTLDLAVDAKGNLEAKGTENYVGFAAAMIREGISHVDPRQRRQGVEAGLAQSFGPLTLETLTFEGDDPGSPPGTPLTIHFAFHADGWGRASGSQLVVPGQSLFPAQLSRRLIRQADRKTTLLLDTETTQTMHVTITVPKGMSVSSAASKPVVIDAPFGHYERQTSAAGGALKIDEHLALALMRVPPKSYPALARFCAAIDQVQARDIAFGGPPPAAPVKQPEHGAAGTPAPAGAAAAAH